jgi:transcriptional regulator with GAF, ATPase, and Fis domain
MGLFEAADAGTLFLDELPSLSLALQSKVLTVIEDGKIRRLGANRTIQIDVRIIAATNQDLKQLVALGKFREDCCTASIYTALLCRRCANAERIF